jgi:hypothetical protein
VLVEEQSSMLSGITGDREGIRNAIHLFRQSLP